MEMEPLKPVACFKFEVEKVVGVSSDGRYQVQWAPCWVSKFHLIDCDHLIQEFLQEEESANETQDDFGDPSQSHKLLDETPELEGHVPAFQMDEDISIKRNVGEKNHATSQEYFQENSMVTFDLSSTVNDNSCPTETQSEEPERNSDDSDLSESPHNGDVKEKRTKVKGTTNIANACNTIDELLSSWVRESQLTNQEFLQQAEREEKPDTHSSLLESKLLPSLDGTPSATSDYNMVDVGDIDGDAGATRLEENPLEPASVCPDEITGLANRHRNELSETTPHNCHVVLEPIRMDMKLEDEEEELGNVTESSSAEISSPLGSYQGEDDAADANSESVIEMITETCGRTKFDLKIGIREEEASELSELLSAFPAMSSPLPSILRNLGASDAKTNTAAEEHSESTEYLPEHKVPNETSVNTFNSTPHQTKPATTSKDINSLGPPSPPSSKTIKYTCNVCRKHFSSWRESNHHFKKSHKGVKPFKCTYCHKRFDRKRELKTHMCTHKAEKPFSCPQCSYKCVHSASLRYHMLKHTGKRPYTCDKCDKSFILSSQLKTHQSSHGGEKLYPCSICEKKFTTNGHLKDHLRIHTLEKPYPCTFCDKKFKRSHHLKEHLKTHMKERPCEEKPFQCEFCDLKCKQRGQLNEHLKTHTKEKPYTCTFCEKKFARRAHLKRHILSHTGEEPYVCPVCGQGFRYLKGLKGHSKRCRQDVDK